MNRILLFLSLVLWLQAGQAETPKSGDELPDGPTGSVFFGDVHSHTVASTDANALDTFATVEEALAFARGSVSEAYNGEKVTIREPLDFVVATDHSETQAVQGLCYLSQFGATDEPLCRQLKTRNPNSAESRFDAGQLYENVVLKINLAPVDQPAVLPLCEQYDCDAAAVAFWTRYRQDINRFDAGHPGLSAFIGYEYTKHPNGVNYHHQMVYRGGNTAGFPYGYTEARSVHDLIRQVDRECTPESDCDYLLIDHNPIQSKGTRFSMLDKDGEPWTRESAQAYIKRAPLVEIFQNKGNQECRTGLGNDDPFCNFENVPATPDPPLCPAPGEGKYGCVMASNYVRNGLKIGLLLQEKIGANPYKKGFVAATDNHVARPGKTDETGHAGEWGYEDARPDLRLTPFRLLSKQEVNNSTMPFDGYGVNPGGLAAVHASENTREAIFDAMQQRRTYATSGTRIRLHVFAGWKFGSMSASAVTGSVSELIGVGQKHGVPMGSDLPPVDGEAPGLVIAAERDPGAARLQRLQVIKVWAKSGQTGERVFDVALSPRQPPADAVIVNGGVDDHNPASPSGSDHLTAIWVDPDFDAETHAAYYVRVIEESSYRYAYYDALALGWDEEKMKQIGAERHIPWTLQERAWSSPVWYTPAGN
jgi:hypothetical protein